MRSELKSALVAGVAALAVAGVAVADTIIGDADSNTNSVAADVQSSITLAPNQSRTARFGLLVNDNATDTLNGCNTQASTPVVLRVTSDKSWVTVSATGVVGTYGSSADILITDCDPDTLADGLENGTLVHYKTGALIPAAEQATVTAAYLSGGRDADRNLSNGFQAASFSSGSFTVNSGAPANTPPTVVVAGVTDGASYDKGTVPAATCDVTDAEDGDSSFAATLSAVTGPYASDGIGSQTASCSYTDGGGLNDTDSATYSIGDPTPPVIQKVVTPSSPDGANGWYVSDVTVDWTVTDSDSPNSLQATGCVDQNITADQAATEYSCSATSAGGSAGPESVTIKRDATDPTITDLGPTAGPDGDNGWYVSDVTNQFKAEDATSGLSAACAAVFDQAGGVRNVTVSDEGAAVKGSSGTCTDDAGNSADSIDSAEFMIDKTAPTVTVTGVADGASYTLGTVPTAGCSTTDTVSDVATEASVSTSGGPVGSVTATCSGGKDNAGNTRADTSVTYNVTYAFLGFFRPIDNLPTLNSVKAGSSVPVKFSLGGNQGLSIFAAGYPQSGPITCGSNPEIDAVEETSTAGQSSLSYDATADQYNYVWKTEKGWAGTCRQLVVKLRDNTYHRANFKLTK